MIERLLISVLALMSVLFSPAGHALDDWQALPTGTVSRIAFGTCAKQWQPQPVWGAIATGNYHFYDFTASGMTHVIPDYANAANKHRIAGPYVEPTIGLVDIDWEGDPEPVIRSGHWVSTGAAD